MERECSVFKKTADKNNKYQNGNDKNIMPFHERRHLKTSAYRNGSAELVPAPAERAINDEYRLNKSAYRKPKLTYREILPFKNALP